MNLKYFPPNVKNKVYADIQSFSNNLITNLPTFTEKLT